MCAWIILVMSGVLEAAWATALGRSENRTKATPTIVFGVTLVLSMTGLALAMREIPTGSAYAVWVGIGATLTVTVAMGTGTEPISLVEVLLIVGLVGCAVGRVYEHLYVSVYSAEVERFEAFTRTAEA